MSNKPEQEYVAMSNDGKPPTISDASSDEPPPYESLPRNLSTSYANTAVDDDSTYSYVDTSQVPQERQGTRQVPQIRQGARQVPEYRPPCHMVQQRPLPSAAQYESAVPSPSDNHEYDQMRLYYTYSGPDVADDGVRTDESYEYSNSYEYPTMPSTALGGTAPTGQRAQLQVQTAANAPPQSDGSRRKARAWLPWSVVSLVILCLPLGIAAVVLSALIMKDNKKGKYEAAKRKSTAVLVINVVATVFGGIIILVVVGGVVLIAGICAACTRRV